MIRWLASQRVAVLGLCTSVLVSACGASKSSDEQRAPAAGGATSAGGSAGGAALGGGVARAGSSNAGSEAGGSGAAPGTGASGGGPEGGGSGGSQGSAGAGGAADAGASAAGGTSSGGKAGGGGSAGKGTSGSAGEAGHPLETGGSGAGGAPADTCAPIPCPDLGTCTAELRGATCVRTCTPRFPQYDLMAGADFGPLLVSKCNVFDGSFLAGGEYIVSLTGLQNLHEITGQLVLFQTSLKNLKGLEGLQRVGQGMNIEQDAALESVELPALEEVVGGMQLDQLSVATTIDLPAMRVMSDRIFIESNPLLQSIHLAELEQADQLDIELNASLTTLEVPALTAVRLMYFSQNTMFPQCEVDALATRVGGCDYPASCMGNDTSATCP